MCTGFDVSTRSDGSRIERSERSFPDATVWTSVACPSDYPAQDAHSPSSTEGGVKSLHFSLSGTLGGVTGPPLGHSEHHPFAGVVPHFGGKASFHRLALSVACSSPHLACAWYTIDTRASGDWLACWSRQFTLFSSSRLSGSGKKSVPCLPPVTLSSSALARRIRSGEYTPGTLCIGDLCFNFATVALLCTIIASQWEIPGSVWWAQFTTPR